MIDLEELSKKVLMFRATRKMSIDKLAKSLGVSFGTLEKIIRKQSVKETTRIYVWEKLDILEKLEKEGE